MSYKQECDRCLHILHTTRFMDITIPRPVMILGNAPDKCLASYHKLVGKWNEFRTALQEYQVLIADRVIDHDCNSVNQGTHRVGGK